MTQVQRNNRNPVVLPYRGVDLRVPIFDMPSEFSPMSWNFILNDGKATKRPGHTGTASGTTISIGAYNSAAGDPIWDHIKIALSGNTTTEAGTVATPAGIPIYADHTVFRNLVMVPNDSTGIVHNLTPATPAWANGLTFTNQVTGQRKPITHYRERVYLGDGFKLYYGGAGSTSGAMTAFDLTNLIHGLGIAGLGTFSYSGGVGPDQVLVICSNVGEVLMYSGSYPGGTDWQLINKFNLMLDFQASVGSGLVVNTSAHAVEMIDVPGDLLINSRANTDIFSVRTLLGSQDSFRSSLGARLRPLYKTADGAFCKTVAYVPKKNWLVIAIEISIFEAYNKLLYDWANELGFYSGVTDSGKFLAIIDLDSEENSMHFHTGGSAGTDSSMSATPNHALLGAQKLFNEDSPTDQGSVAVDAILAFPPFSGGYDLKTSQQLIMYSNFVSNHALSVAMNKDFNISPGTFANTITSETSGIIKSKVIGASQIGGSFIIQIREDSDHSVPFELQGLQILTEGAGAY